MLDLLSSGTESDGVEVLFLAKYLGAQYALSMLLIYYHGEHKQSSQPHELTVYWKMPSVTKYYTVVNATKENCRVTRAECDRGLTRKGREGLQEEGGVEWKRRRHRRPSQWKAQPVHQSYIERQLQQEREPEESPHG